MREIFLDTTYVMPFFYMDIDVKGFSRRKYAELIQKLERIHISEISIFEAKVKALKTKSSEVLKKFNKGLSILRSDKKVVIHGYTAEHDRSLNEMLKILNDINIIDLFIVSQGFSGCSHRHMSALGHINLNSLWVHREYIIGLVPFRGNPSSPFGEGKPHILSNPSHPPTT